MDGRQSLVATTGAGLAAVTFWTTSQRGAIGGTLWNKSDPAKAHSALLALGGELLLVAILTFAAGTSDTAANATLALLAALWILWAIQHYGGGKKAAQTSAPSQAPKMQGA